MGARLYHSEVAVSLLIAFGFGFVGSMPLTGPIAVMVVTRAVQGQPGQAARIGLGAAAAEAFYAGVAMWGFATFLSRHAWVLTASRGVSAVVFAAIGIHFLVWRPKPSLPPESRFTGLLEGFTVSALNPTLLATWTGAVAALYGHGLAPREPIAALPFGAAAGLGVAVWELAMVALIRKSGNRVPARLLTWVIRGMGLLVIGAGVISAVSFVRALARGGR
jgi:threonine/homoserine/homoserine lactone efflux protein